MKFFRICFIFLLLCCISGCRNKSEDAESSVTEEPIAVAQEALPEQTNRVQNPTEKSTGTGFEQEDTTTRSGEKAPSATVPLPDVDLTALTNTTYSDGGIELPDDIW